MNHGINFFGPYQARDSIGRVAGLNIACLEASNVPHDVHLLTRPGPNEIIDYATIDDHLISTLKYKVNLFHFNARRVPLYFARLGEHSLKGFYNIGFWAHEMQTIPNQWARQLEFFNEIWTPSSLCHSAIAHSSKIPVLKFPYPIESNPITDRMRKIANGETFSEFNFLAIFDVVSDVERKNPLLMIRAFLNAHRDHPTVRLIMKTRHLSQDANLEKILKSTVQQHPNIILIDGYMENHELVTLYDQADAYVSLHRAEGFGLTISDAMSRGIPVITTGYSGNMDFCNSAETRTVSYSLCEVGHNRPRYRSNDLWAEPDLEDATDAFNDLVNNQRSWVKKAARARNRLEQEFSVNSIGDLMKRRIDLINHNFFFTDDMSDRTIDMEIGISKFYGF